ncbi:MAG: hypoxanthine phosphoribosyltransferase [bacterium]
MKILISSKEIEKRTDELAKEIDEFIYKLSLKEEPFFICVLTGSIFFFSELVRKLKHDVITDYIKVSSYKGTQTTHNVKILKDISLDIKNRVVFIVEDIIDTGLTLNKIVSLFREREPRDIFVCALLDKPSQRIVDVKVDFVGFTIPPEFVVGYGLDFDEKYRNKPYIYTLK